MCRYFKMIATIACLLLADVQLAHAEGEWCQPFKIIKGVEGGHEIDGWIQRIFSETRKSIDPKVEVRWDPDAPALEISDIVSRLDSGAAALAVVDAAQLAAFYPGFAALDYPGLIVDYDSIVGLYKGGKYLRYMAIKTEKANIGILAISRVPYVLAFNEADVGSLNALTGLKVSGGTIFQASLLSELGAEPVNVPSERLFQEFASGEVQGAITLITDLDNWEAKEKQIVKSIVRSPVYARSLVLLGSEKFVSRAPKRIAEKFKNVVREASLEFNLALFNKADDQAIRLNQAGIEMVEFPTGDSIGIEESWARGEYYGNLSVNIGEAINALKADVW